MANKQKSSSSGVDIQYDSSIVDSSTVVKYYSLITPNEELLSNKTSLVAEPLLLASLSEKTKSGFDSKEKVVMDAAKQNAWTQILDEWATGNIKVNFLSLDWYNTDTVNCKIKIQRNGKTKEVKLVFPGLTKSLERRTADFNRMIEDRCGDREWYHSKRQDGYIYSMACFQMPKGKGQGLALSKCMLICKMTGMNIFDYVLYIDDKVFLGTSDNNVSPAQKKMGIFSRAYPIKSSTGGGVPLDLLDFLGE